MEPRVEMVRLEFSSLLTASPAQVWDRVSTMTGVNHELSPWMRMTHPAEATDLQSPLLKLGTTAFHSWILLFGLLPLDRHALCLERVLPDVGFDERSRSWLQSVWIHRRRVQADPCGCRLSDELEFEPRMVWMTPVLRTIVTALFQHRHQRLQRQFGTADG